MRVDDLQLATMAGRSGQELRRAAAAELTALLERHEAFSFVRLSDGEVRWLREMQAGESISGYNYAPDLALSVEVVRSVNGMEARHYPRFLAALEHATYLDRCDSTPRVRQYLSELNLPREAGLYGNSSPETSNIIFEWTWYEFGGYLARHRCLIAAAEAALLRELATDPAYREITGALLPDAGMRWFHQIRDDGRRYSENLDLIKTDLLREIEAHAVDTVFLCLGTGAKVLAYEIAREANVRVIDFGSMVRALTYSGSTGYQAGRAKHNPFFFRVPMDVFMPALGRAHPNLTRAEITARAHAQLVLELHRHQRFEFNTSDGIHGGGIDLSADNLRQFQESLAYYNRHLRGAALADPAARQLDAAFRKWCLKKGIGWQGRAFRSLVAVKAVARVPAQFLRIDTGSERLTPGRALYLARDKFGHGVRAAWYRDVVRPRIRDRQPFSETTDYACEIHVLTSQADYLNLLWALHSFFAASRRQYALCIHDDGTLTADAVDQLLSAFPAARLISRREGDARLSELLAPYKRCRELRATNNLALKIFDFAAFLQSDRMMLLDSDILFFSRPEGLLTALEGGARNSLNRDWRYGYSIDEDAKLDFELPPLINSGLGLIHRASIRYDWIEDFLTLPNILSHPHRIEQTLFALCSARFGFDMLPAEYDVHLGPAKPGIPSRHYVGPIRHLMYSEGMRCLVRDGLLNGSAAHRQ